MELRERLEQLCRQMEETSPPPGSRSTFDAVMRATDRCWLFEVRRILAETSDQ